MPLIVWNDLLETGFDAIDLEHRELVNVINRLHDAVTAGEGDASIVDQALARVRDYTIYRFRNEEALMARHGFEGVEEHHQIHSEMVSAVDQLIHQRETGEDGIAEKLLDFLRTWLVRHILGADRAVALYLQRKTSG